MHDRERTTMSARNAFGIAFLLALSLLQFGCGGDAPANNSSNKPANVVFNAADNQNTAGNKSLSNVSPVPPRCREKIKGEQTFECPKGETVRMVIEPPDLSSNASVSIDRGTPRILTEMEFVVDKKRRIFVQYVFTPASGRFVTKFLDSRNTVITSESRDRPIAPNAGPPKSIFVFESR